jgi:thiamine biosynthesis lipoprotein
MRPEAHYFDAMGTSCGLFAIGQPRARLLEVEAWVDALAARLTRFTPDSELSRLNACAGQWVAVSADLQSILSAAMRASEMSAGLVNVAVLPSMLAVGYTQPLLAGPTAARSDELTPLPALCEVLEVRRGAARVAKGAGIDLGGVAKGWMADHAVRLLGSNAVVNLGGDLMAVGPGPGGEGWPVGLGGATLLLRDQGAATSSVRRRRWGSLHHLIDPRTGAPARTGLEEVSVVASSGFEAEVIAKAALLLGPESAVAYCATHALAWWLASGDDS